NNIIYIQSDGSEKIQSYQDLWQQAQRILTGLRKLGLKPQDKIIFQLSHNFDIIPAFWGCLLGGFVPLIIPPLQSYEEKNQAVDKICHVWQLLDNPFILTTEYLQKNLNSLSQWLPNPELNPQLKICVIEELRINNPDLNYHPSQPDDIAFFNLTSGSTGMPKCIGLTHKNLISRARGVNILCNFRSSDVILNWLPFDHIGSISDWHIRCIDVGCQLVYVQTEYILSRPLNWLDLIDKFRITHSWSPNFAYGLINHALKQEQRQNWNLE
ncbi:MAG: AMP-binding protein, partial [Dolichospermum sp.]